jgi:hypothetical protein
MGGSDIEGTPPAGDPEREWLVRVLVASAFAAELVAMTSNSPAVLTAGLFAWTLRVLLELR